MQGSKVASCQCGKVRITAAGREILSGECLCNSCRTAGAFMQSLDGAPPLLGAYGGTAVVVYRKDRVSVEGAGYLKAFRLTPASKTRRVVATCCNTPMFIEFLPGHWFSLYARNFNAAERPPVESRSFTRDLPDRSLLPDDAVNAKVVSAGFVWKMLASFAAMGFHAPETTFVNGTMDGPAPPP